MTTCFNAPAGMPSQQSSGRHRTVVRTRLSLSATFADTRIIDDVMTSLYRQSAGFGKRTEFWTIGRMLEALLAEGTPPHSSTFIRARQHESNADRYHPQCFAYRVAGIEDG